MQTPDSHEVSNGRSIMYVTLYSYMNNVIRAYFIVNENND